jgi:hypothetical protein
MMHGLSMDIVFMLLILYNMYDGQKKFKVMVAELRGIKYYLRHSDMDGRTITLKFREI